MIESERDARNFVAARCDDVAMERLTQFADLLLAENERQNLVSRGTVDNIWRRHFADSAQLLDHVPRGTWSGDWLDLGTGAGFPGLVIAAMRPEASVKIVESRRKRVEFLQNVGAALGLSNAKVLGSRLEVINSFAASVISARAFAPLPKLLDLATRFSTGGTTWLLPKGRSAAQEVAELPPRWRKMFHVEPSQTDAEAGIIVGRMPKEATK